MPVIEQQKVMQANEKLHEASFEVPSVFANRTFLATVDGVARLTFAEAANNNSQVNFRASIAMPLGCLIGLRDLINTLEAQAQAQQATKQ